MSVSFEQRQILITHHPFFSTLSDDAIAKLARLAYEKKYDAASTIVSEGEMVDAVYLIEQGRIEISRFVPTNQKEIPQGLLYSGEAIGLNYTGFFSHTMLRTATLNALSDVTLIGWNIDTFCDFLKNYPQFTQALQDTTDQIARMNFIKQAIPFTQLPLSEIAKLANQVKKITVPAGTILFRQGDKGETCFLIESGSVEISIAANGGEKKVALLESPALFGECALLTSAPRNATARVMQTATLFELHRDSLQSIVEHHSAYESLMNLVIERSYPVRHANVIANSRVAEDGETLIILKDPAHGRYFQLSSDGWFIWQLLDGTHTLQDITMALFKEKNVFSPDVVADIILNLVDAGFVALPKLHSFLAQENSTQSSSGWRELLKKIMIVRLSFTKVDAFFTTTYQKIIRYFYTTFAQWILFAIMLSGGVAFLMRLPVAIATLPTVPHLIEIFIGVFLVSLLSTVFHELAHAYTVKYFNREVHHVGALFYWLGLAVFVDTSDMWLANKRERIWVGVAGPYVDLVMAGIASLIAIYSANPSVALFFWLLALVLYYGVLKNLNPLIENDGYLALKDFFSYPSLRQDALTALRDFLKINKPIFFYWMACLVFLLAELFFVGVLTYHLQFILPENVVGISTAHVVWLLPCLVLAFFCFHVFILLKKSSSSLHHE